MDTFVLQSPVTRSIEGLPLLPLDEIVAQLKLERVDFIKMDIEGAERFALRGSEQTLKRFKPRMAIASYHSKEDAVLLPAIVKSAVSGYDVHAKDVAISAEGIYTKVLLFH
jgi:hypothetical protein